MQATLGGGVVFGAAVACMVRVHGLSPLDDASESAAPLLHETVALSAVPVGNCVMVTDCEPSPVKLIVGMFDVSAPYTLKVAVTGTTPLAEPVNVN